MDKFITLHDKRDLPVVVNGDHISYFYRAGTETLTEVRLDSKEEVFCLYVKEPVEEILALLTGDRKYFAEKAREARRLERENRNVKPVEDDCTPVVDLPPYGAVMSATSPHVTSCHHSSITNAVVPVPQVVGPNRSSIVVHAPEQVVVSSECSTMPFVFTHQEPVCVSDVKVDKDNVISITGGNASNE